MSDAQGGITPPGEYVVRRSRRSLPALSIAVVAVVALTIVLWGGYGRHWAWTGINGQTATLWDWLHLLLLPIAVGILPIWLSRQARLRPAHKLGSAVFLGAFTVVVVAGYTVPWAWTGFRGNKLWDWLELLVLPLAVALTPVFGELRRYWSRRHTTIALSGLAVFVVVVVGGYVGNWSWTGFRGNTFWDWLHLLLLPLLIPMLVVPALTPIASASVLRTGEPDPAREPAAPGQAARPRDSSPGGPAVRRAP